MRLSPTLPLALASLAVTLPLRADETPAKGKVVGVDLFKNGLAVVRCETTLGKPGTYALADVPHPVHGTFWVESPAAVEATVRMREVEVPVAEAAPGNPQDDFAGKKVTLTFKGGNRPPVVGTMLKLKPAKEDTASAFGGPGARSQFLVLQTGTGRTYVEASEVASVETGEGGDKVTRRKPRLLLTLKEADKPETKVTLRYLTHGLTWAPSYRLDISDPKALALEQHAVVKNELADLTDVEVRLISGFPSVQFAHVRSLFHPDSTLAAFFSELDSGPSRRYADATSNVLYMQSVGNRANPFAPAIGATPTGEGVDLHYQPIGKRTLADGDSLALTVAKGKADYERIVEWVVPDKRNESGRYDADRRDRDEEEDAAWDALRFKNPLPFPMTTGPATVTANGAFNGQRTSYWVNAGEETVVRVEKALSVRTRATESEVADKDGGRRELVWVGGREYRKSTVDGELEVGNNRKEAVQLVIRRQFSGELVKADGDPKSSLRAEGVFSVNKRYELVWPLSLKGGEQKKLKYTHTVLVPN